LLEYFNISDISNIYDIYDIGKHRGTINRMYTASYVVQLRIVISTVSFSKGERNNSRGRRNEDKVRRVLCLITLVIKSQTDNMLWYDDDKLKIHIVPIDIMLCSV